MAGNFVFPEILDVQAVMGVCNKNLGSRGAVIEQGQYAYLNKTGKRKELVILRPDSTDETKASVQMFIYYRTC